VPTGACIWQNKKDAMGWKVKNNYLREQAERRAKSIKQPDIYSMTLEEIQQRFHELQVKQIEVELQNEQLRSRLDKRNDDADLFRVVNENMLDMVALTDMEGNFLFAGKSHEILGYDPGLLIGKNAMDFVHPEDLPRIQKEFTEFVASGYLRTVEYRYRRKDGSYIWLETIGNVIKDEDGIPQKIVFSSRVINERKQAEEKLLADWQRADRQRSAIVMMALNDAVVSCDIATALHVITRVLCETTEVARASVWFLSDDGSELQCRSLYEAGPSRHTEGGYLSAETFPAYFESLRAESRISAVHARSDPRTRELLEGHLSPLGITSLLDAAIFIEGTLVGVVSLEHVGNPRAWHPDEESFISTAAALVGQVIAEDRRKQAQKKLESNYTLLAIAGKTTRFGGWRIDLASNTVTWSDTVADIHEVPRGYSPGVSEAMSFYAPEWQDRITQVFRDCARKGIPYDEEMEVITGTGKRIWVRTVGQAEYDKRGNIVAVQGSLQDITEHKRAVEKQKRLQSQLHQAQKLESVGRLAGGIAHDFNNKLTIINGYAEMALDTMNPSDPLREIIREIHTAGKNSADIVRQLLAFARQEDVSPVKLDLNDVISSTLKMLQRLIGENIDLTWNPGPDLWPVIIDPSQVDQILANLAVNSRDAISDVGRLTIETRNTVVDEEYCKTNREAIPGRYIMLAVSDDGCGMDKEVMSQMFEPFFTTKEIGKGTGLGLATVYGIVKQNKGFVNVYSEPGQGTTFRVYFPSCEVEKNSVCRPEGFAGQMPAGSETILLVEDEPAILEMGRKMTEHLGYTVLTAGNPNDALSIGREYDGAIHLLITDVVMPEMNGRDLASRMATNRPGLKTLFMSGYTASAIAHNGLLDEGVKFLQKPFSLKDLAEKVREAIEDAAAKSLQTG